jgi:hypothetical protein
VWASIYNPGEMALLVAWKDAGAAEGPRKRSEGMAIVYIGAALAEIAGCFSFWMWLGEGKPVWWLAPAWCRWHYSLGC